MKKISILSIILGLFMAGTPLTFAIDNPTLPVNEPIVTNITSSSATVSVPASILSTLTPEQISAIYFEYIQANQVCIMIYPTPENCLPKKTTKGQSTVTLTGLNPSTYYNVFYKVDNMIACVTTPCPGNGFISNQTSFKTLASSSTTLSRNLYYRSRGADVALLQDFLRAQGYLSSQSTGYFGIATFKAVKAFQKNYMHIPPTGYVGIKTRTTINNLLTIQTETFEGTIQGVSTACFADGECSVTIDGKKVITTIGWSQETVGSIRGTVSSIGDIETSKIGARAKVYARKLSDGSYTLYGNANYYIEVM